MSDFLRELVESGQFAVEGGKIRMLGEYVMVFPSGVMVRLYGLLAKEIGRKKAEKLMEELGRFQVEAAARRYLERYNFKDMSKEKIYDFTVRILNAIGWGTVKVTGMDVTKKRAAVVVEGGAFPIKWLLINGKSSYPIDFWLKGMITEHFAVIFGGKMKVVEKKCLACGDPYCLFEVSKA
jgi:hypothetical protein